jgi:aspartyl-tRNA(Asn)/glutamyl-tRNA(Gln) amidotransferase subunit B
VASKAKLFSGAAVGFGAGPNEQVSTVDAGFPGMLPVINRYCVEQAVRTGLGLNAQINLTSRFDRKNYFYPDLPTGYQISQYKDPIVGEGEIEVERDDGSDLRGAHRAAAPGAGRGQVDPRHGPALHLRGPEPRGTALMEIVSKPDMRSAEKRRPTSRRCAPSCAALGTCDGDMEKGNLRADVNVSVRKPGGELGTRCEIKNVNSFRFIQQAIEYEARRQIEILEDGGKIDQETRLFDPTEGETRSMRSKEEAHDYRYFPDPDLLPLVLDAAWVKEIQTACPSCRTPSASASSRPTACPSYDAGVLTAETPARPFFEAAAGRDAKLVANWTINDLLGRLGGDGREIEDSPISAEAIGELVGLITDGTISSKIAKQVFDHMWAGEGSPAAIVEKHGLVQVTDTVRSSGGRQV